MAGRPLLPFAWRAGLLAGFLFFVGLTLYEIWRRGRHPGSVTAGQFRRRVAGAVIMAADLLLWVVADAFLPGWPPAWQLLYMGGAMLLLFVPMFLAVREWTFVVRQYARSRAE